MISPATRANATAMNSAILDTGVIHFAPARPKTLLISIPIKLTATKKTKLAIYIPQETKSRRPVTTRPSLSWIEYAYKHAIRRIVRNVIHK